MLFKYIKFHYKYIKANFIIWAIMVIYFAVITFIGVFYDKSLRGSELFLMVMFNYIINVNVLQNSWRKTGCLLMKILPLKASDMIKGEYICQISNYFISIIILIIIRKFIFNSYDNGGISTYYLLLFIMFVYYSIVNVVMFSNIGHNIKIVVNCALLGGICGFISSSSNNIYNFVIEMDHNIIILIMGIVISIYIGSYFLSLKFFKNSDFN